MPKTTSRGNASRARNAKGSVAANREAYGKKFREGKKMYSKV